MGYDSYKSPTVVPFTQHTEYVRNLAEKEVWRSPTFADSRWRLHELGLTMLGGGSDGNLTLRAYDGTTAGTQMESVTGGSYNRLVDETGTNGNPLTLSIQNDGASEATASIWLVVELV